MNPKDGPPPARRPSRVLAAATLSSTSAFVPVFLLGALAELIRADLGFGEQRLGLAVSVFFGAAALTSVHGGRMAERLGAWRGMSVSATAAAGILLGIAATARSWVMLAAWLACAGVVNAVAQPAADLALARGVPARWQGTAYGARTGSVPVATLLAGAAVPALGLTVGWRWAFATGALLSVGYALVARRASLTGPGAAVTSGPAGSALPLAALVLLAIAVGAGIGVQHAMSTFYVTSAIASGHPPALAGVLLALGGLAAITGRMVWGGVADLTGRGSFRLIAALMAVGAVGLAGLAVSGSPALLALCTVIAYGAGSGWNGLWVLAVVRTNQATPARAIGVVMVGAFAGGIAGPAGLGYLVEAHGYAVAWRAAATALGAAACLAVITGRRLRRLAGVPAR